MKKISIFMALIAVSAIVLYSFVDYQIKKKTFLFVSYNVENLMDTIDNPFTKDDEFTPNGQLHWNSERYFKKLNDIAKVISSIDKTHFPDFISLAEVENKNVVEDLLKTQPFKGKNYQVIHFETSDMRGIDVALVYNPEIFKPIETKQIPLISDSVDLSGLRQTLFVKGIVGKDTLFILVNHWKARVGGQAKTEPLRIATAKIIRQVCDSILKINPNANIISVGDYNDTPFDVSIEKDLNASTDSTFNSPLELFNLTAFEAKQNKGTISYDYKWQMIDNMIVSQSLIKKHNDIKAVQPAESFGQKDINLFYNTKADDYVPNKTYGGKTYFGGVSDHLPVYDYFNYK